MKYALVVLIILVIVLTITVAFLLGKGSATVDAVPTLRETPYTCDANCQQATVISATNHALATSISATETDIAAEP